MEEEKKFEVGFTIHSYENGNWAPLDSGSQTLGINNALTPLKILDDKGDYFIPTVVANYFTEEQMDKDRWTVLENITAGLLPEFQANAFRSFSSLAAKLRNTKYLKVLGENPAFQKILVELSSTRYMAKYLSLEEEVAVRLYTSGYYSGLNRALRGEIAITEEYKVYKELLNNALNKLPKTSSSTFYRLEKWSPESLKKEYITGKTVEKKAFTSSTYDYMAAEEMMFDDASYNVLIKIIGKNGKNIEEASLLPAEKEVLFKSNTKFLVGEIKPIPSPVNPNENIMFINWKIKMEKKEKKQRLEFLLSRNEVLRKKLFFDVPKNIDKFKKDNEIEYKEYYSNADNIRALKLELMTPEEKLEYYRQKELAKEKYKNS